MKKYFLLLLVVAFSAAATHAQPPSADEVLKDASTQAAKENKNVFIIFHASWCVWCHKMDTAMADPSCKDFFERSYVVKHLTVSESPNKKNLENPGAMEMLAKYGGGNGGIPFWLIFDKDGKLLADSQLKPGVNSGCPASKEEVAYFITVLKKTSSITDAEVAAVEKRFRRNE